MTDCANDKDNRRKLVHEPTMVTTFRGVQNIREISRFQREKKNEYINGLQIEAHKVAQEVQDSDVENTVAFKALQSLRQTYITRISFC